MRSLVLIGPTGLGEDEAEPEPLARWVRLPRGGQRIFDLLVSRVSLQREFAKAFEGQVDPELAEYAYLSARCQGARYAAGAFLRGLLSTPNARRDIYERVGVPTLVVHDDGAYSNFSQVPRLVAENPNVYAEQVGHARANYPHFEAPEMTFLLLEQAWGQSASQPQSLSPRRRPRARVWRLRRALTSTIRSHPVARHDACAHTRALASSR